MSVYHKGDRLPREPSGQDLLPDLVKCLLEAPFELGAALGIVGLLGCLPSLSLPLLPLSSSSSRALGVGRGVAVSWARGGLGSCRLALGGLDPLGLLLELLLLLLVGDVSLGMR